MDSVIQIESWPIAGSFAISRGVKRSANVITVELSQSGIKGRGECVPYERYDETPEIVVKTIESMLSSRIIPENHHHWISQFPAGAARNALDCALWDLRAKKANKRIWELLDIETPKNVTTAYTLSLDSPAKMQENAEKNKFRPLLKLKLAGDGDLERVRAVRAGAPDSSIIVDANEGWRKNHYEQLVPEFLKLNIMAIEQPFPADNDQILSNLPRPIPVIADESCHTWQDIERLRHLYDGVNIKLDKTGGLTEALKLKQLAVKANMQIMVGCMVGTSLAMAPALLLAKDATIVDLDGPLLLAEDRENGIQFNNSSMSVPSAALWG